MWIMNRRNIVRILLLLCLVIVGLSGCVTINISNKSNDGQKITFEIDKPDNQTHNQDNNNTDASSDVALNTDGDEEIYIVYTNDVHSYVYNNVTEQDGTVEPGMRLSNVAALVADMRADGKNVILVDAGDEIQGDVYGAFDSGKSVIQLMNKCGYQLATPGNHEFDYGMNTFFQRIGEADYPFISCNFHSTESDVDPLEDSYIFEIGGKKVAFVGISTPETITSSTPVYFQNEKGEYIYTVDGISGKEDLFQSVQKAVDAVRDKADYVIALGHVGAGMQAIQSGMSSYDIIKNVSGLNAFIDGHSHATVECDKAIDKDGKTVILTQTGCYLGGVGIMKISSDEITSTLINEYDNQIDEIATMESDIYNRLQEEMGEIVGDLKTTLYVNNPSDSQQRLIRSREMNSGDFIADSIYWYFNDKINMNCDVAIMNGGGIRAQLEAGEKSYLDVKTVQPFGNMICLIEASGQTILDALEMGVDVTGTWSDDGNRPAENGGFLHVAGMKYTVDATIPSGIVVDDDGMFTSVDGDYRVRDVMIYNRQLGEYQPLELDKMYKLGGSNYLLRNSGTGLGMFATCDAVVDYVDVDYMIMSYYMEAFTKDGEYASIITKNSPLSNLDGYLIDYENPYGADRISIIMN